MFERVLVPLDGSEVAEAILPDVRKILAGEKADVILLRVMEVQPHEFTLDFPNALKERGTP